MLSKSIENWMLRPPFDSYTDASIAAHGFS